MQKEKRERAAKEKQRRERREFELSQGARMMSHKNMPAWVSPNC
ncbi:hypothetical protein [Mesorhizobium sp. CN2-181]